MSDIYLSNAQWITTCMALIAGTGVNVKAYIGLCSCIGPAEERVPINVLRLHPIGAYSAKYRYISPIKIHLHYVFVLHKSAFIYF